jgi:tRNA A-37 threonylcarbamoyl transferase component Bud32
MPETVDYEQIVREFVHELRQGREPSVEVYAQRYEDHSDCILAEFDGLSLAEMLRPPEKSITQGPKQLGPYELIQMIARGGMGSVYHAYQPSLKRSVAVKVLNKRNVDHEHFLRRFKREAMSASRLPHPNIVSVFDHGIENGIAWLAMPFINGISLDKVVNGAEIEWRDDIDASVPGVELKWQWIARWGAQIASALQFAHNRGTIHRDVKPGNLILDNNGRVWITDFGLAKLKDEESSLSRTGDMIGTPRYMAPEQIRGNADERSDIYGLGVTLYELACGKRVWEAISGNDLVQIKSSMELPEIREVNADIPVGLANIIMKAVAFQPEDRYQTAGELRTVFQRFSDGERITDRRKAPRDATPRPYLRKPFLVMMLTAALLGGFMLASYYIKRAAIHAELSMVREPLVDASQPIDILENTRYVGFPEIPLSLKDKHGLRWDLSGPDASQFFMNPATGEIAFAGLTDFEKPKDSDLKNDYQISVKALHPSTGTTHESDLTIRVTNENEPPKFASSLLTEGADRQVLYLRAGMKTLPINEFIAVDPEKKTVKITTGENSPVGWKILEKNLVFPNGIEPIFSSDAGACHRLTLEAKTLSSKERTPTGFFLMEEDDTPLLISTLTNGEIIHRFVKEFTRVAASNFVGVSSDGDTVLFAMKIPDGKVQLWQSELGANEMEFKQLKMLSADCGLPKTTEAIESRDGKHFYVFAKHPTIPEKRCVYETVLRNDGRFAKKAGPIELPIRNEITGAYCAADELVVLVRADKKTSSFIVKTEPLDGTCFPFGFFEDLNFYGASRWSSANEFDLSANLNLELPVIPLDRPIPDHSTEQGTYSSLLVHNGYTEPVRIKHILPGGVKNDRGELRIGQSLVLGCKSGSVWEFYGKKGELLDAVKVEDRPTAISVNAKQVLVRVDVEDSK